VIPLGARGNGEEVGAMSTTVAEESAMRSRKHFKAKICLVGNPAVGKTSLVRRYVTDAFDDRYLTTVGTKVTKKPVRVADPSQDLDADIDLMIWDTDGGAATSAFRLDQALLGAVGAVIVGDVTRPRTLLVMAELARECAVHLRTGYVNFLFNKVDILPAELRLTLGVRDVLVLHNLDDVPQQFGPILLMPGQSFRLPFAMAASYQFACTAHASGQMSIVVEPHPDSPWARVRWRFSTFLRSGQWS